MGLRIAKKYIISVTKLWEQEQNIWDGVIQGGKINVSEVALKETGEIHGGVQKVKDEVIFNWICYFHPPVTFPGPIHTILPFKSF